MFSKLTISTNNILAPLIIMTKVDGSKLISLWSHIQIFHLTLEIRKNSGLANILLKKSHKSIVNDITLINITLFDTHNMRREFY